MIVYYFVFFITLFIQLVPVCTDKAYRLRLFFTFLPLFLFGSLRVDFGLDYQSYLNFYNQVHQYSDIFLINERMEWGYVMLNKLSPSFRFLIVFTSALTCASYYYLFYKTVPAKYTWLAIILLFLSGDMTIFFMFSGIRNAMAISILIFGISFIKDRNLLYFIFITVFASLFHSSALIFLPLAFVVGRNTPLTKREYYIWLIALFCLLIFPLGRIVDIMSFINLYSGKYDTYIQNAKELGDTRTLLIFFSVTFMTFLILRFMESEKMDKMDNSMTRLALLFVFSFILGSMNVRASQYFIPFFIVTSTNMYAKWKQIDSKNIYLIFILLFLGYSFFVVWLNSPWFSYKEYYSIFSTKN